MSTTLLIATMGNFKTKLAEAERTISKLRNELREKDEEIEKLKGGR